MEISFSARLFSIQTLKGFEVKRKNQLMNQKPISKACLKPLIQKIPKIAQFLCQNVKKNQKKELKLH